MGEKREVVCPNCHSKKVIKNGKSNGKQTYLCKTCYSRFLLNREKERYPVSLKKDVVRLYNEGHTLTELSRKFSIKVQTIHYWIKTLNRKK
ncbi:MAG: IS1 family transposase [Persephonella sp.]|nr:IS1 family transposase [Persephonella sp.]